LPFQKEDSPSFLSSSLDEAEPRPEKVEVNMRRLCSKSHRLSAITGGRAAVFFKLTAIPSAPTADIIIERADLIFHWQGVTNAGKTWWKLSHSANCNLLTKSGAGGGN
jgi:hypothetical protein